MKKIIFGLLLSLSFSNACDNIFDEVAEFKIGCPIEGQKLNKQRNHDILLEELYKSENVNFFDFAEAEVKNGNIEAMSFQKKYTVTTRTIRTDKRKIINDVNKILNTLEKRWGKADKKELEKFLKLAEYNSTWLSKIQDSATIEIEKPKSVKKIILAITADPADNVLKSWNIEIIVLYVSEIALNEIKNRQSKSDLDGF